MKKIFYIVILPGAIMYFLRFCVFQEEPHDYYSDAVNDICVCMDKVEKIEVNLIQNDSIDSESRRIIGNQIETMYVNCFLLADKKFKYLISDEEKLREHMKIGCPSVYKGIERGHIFNNKVDSLIKLQKK